MAEKVDFSNIRIELNIYIIKLEIMHKKYYITLKEFDWLHEFDYLEPVSPPVFFQWTITEKNISGVIKHIKIVKVKSMNTWLELLIDERVKNVVLQSVSEWIIKTVNSLKGEINTLKEVKDRLVHEISELNQDLQELKDIFEIYHKDLPLQSILQYIRAKRAI